MYWGDVVVFVCVLISESSAFKAHTPVYTESAVLATH